MVGYVVGVSHGNTLWVRVSRRYVDAVPEIKLLFCALTGCTSHKTVHPETALCTLLIYSNNKWLKKRAHTGCTPSKIVHPAVEMCTPGAGCTLNFEHLDDMAHLLVLTSVVMQRYRRGEALFWATFYKCSI